MKALIISRGKNNQTSDVDLLENGEGRAIGQMDIHKYQVGHRIFLKPRHAIHDGLQYRDDFRFGTYLAQ